MVKTLPNYKEKKSGPERNRLAAALRRRDGSFEVERFRHLVSSLEACGSKRASGYGVEAHRLLVRCCAQLNTIPPMTCPRGSAGVARLDGPVRAPTSTSTTTRTTKTRGARDWMIRPRSAQPPAGEPVAGGHAIGHT